MVDVLKNGTTKDNTSDHNINNNNNSKIELNGFLNKANSNYDDELVNSNSNNNNNKSDCNNHVDKDINEPPDGGARAWLVMISAFICVGLIFGVINTYSIFYLNIQKNLVEIGDSEASSKAALVGSLTIGTTFLLSPVSGILTDKIGLRQTTLIGGILITSGMLLSSFYTNEINILYITYGVMYGFGASLAYTPSLSILGHYFKRRLGIVNGIVTSGSSVFTASMPIILKYLIDKKNINFTLRFIAAMSSFIICCALVYKPLIVKKPSATVEVSPCSKQNRSFKSRNSLANLTKNLIHVENWRNKKYLIWAVSFALALFGYYVPYVHIGKFIKEEFPTEDENLPIICLGITSGVGRIVFGFIADLPKVNRVLLQQISIASTGIAIMLISVTRSYFMVIVFILIMGLFDGCFITMIGPIAYDICGPYGATQAIGFLFGLCSIPLTIGPPIAGLIYDHTQSYKLPFLLSGISPIFSAILMFLIRCVPDQKEQDQDQVDGEKSDHPLAKITWNSDSDFPMGSQVRNCGTIMGKENRSPGISITRPLLSDANFSTTLRHESSSSLISFDSIHHDKFLNKRKYSYSVL